jgi:tetratricopeptide (TPR) repeat protein
MPNSEYIQHKLKVVETCSPADVSRQCLAILEVYIFLDKAEQRKLAETLYKQAEQSSTFKPLLFCYAKLILAFSFFHREEYEEALRLFTEAQNQFNEQKDLNGAAICSVAMGNIYRTFGNVDLALKSAWAGHDQLEKAVLFQHFLLACNINMGGIYFEMMQYDEAIARFKRVIETAEPTKKYYWLCYALHGLGKIYLTQKKYPEARECFEKAMEDAEHFNHPLAICNSLSEMGNYFFTTGEFSKAEEFFKKSLALREQNKFIGGAITSCIRLGETYIQESKPEEAVAVLEKGLSLAEQVKLKPKMYPIHLLLSQIYERGNNPEKSLFHYKLFHNLREQVETEDNARKLKNAQLVFSAEQTKKENSIIKKQKEEIEKKNIELQETIDELTRVKIGRKAKAFTLVIAIVLFVLEDFILHFVLINLPANNDLISLVVKMIIIFSLSPINNAIENYLLKNVINKKKREVVV